ncbi:hypothetical protein BGX28_008267 [Mortierella sp. GBA30]|nr:hypothetical protein BGX28_008267 [Mortierella sp. GBA30]
MKSEPSIGSALTAQGRVLRSASGVPANGGLSSRHVSLCAIQSQYVERGSDKANSTDKNGPENIAQLPKVGRRLISTTSMETEYIEALYSDLPGLDTSDLPVNFKPNSVYFERQRLEDLRSHSSSESEDIDYEDAGSYDDQGDDGDCEDFDNELDVYEHDDFLSSQEAILMELRREQVEFEENVRQLQQQLQRQGSLLPLSSNDSAEFENMDHCDACSDNVDQPASPVDGSNGSLEIQGDTEADNHHLSALKEQSEYSCNFCSNPKSNLCLEQYGWIWRPLITEAIATAAAAIANFSARQKLGTDVEAKILPPQHPFRYSEFLQQSATVLPHRENDTQQVQCAGNDRTPAVNSAAAGMTPDRQHKLEPVPIRHMYRGTTPPPPAVLYPLPPNAPYKFGRKSSELLEPVGEFHEFQSAEGNSRQVLLHVWPPSSLDVALLEKLEACCRDFQENDVVRGHSGDGFLKGWRPPWKQPHQTGVLRFGHWRVRASAEQGSHLYPPFQTPLTLAAGGGSVLGSTVNLNAPSASASSSTKTRPQTQPQQNGHANYPQQEQILSQQPSSYDLPHHQTHQHCNQIEGGSLSDTNRVYPDEHDQSLQDLHLETSTQGRLLRLIRAIQMVEKGIIARHLKYLFPTLYEKYHGLQFGTPRLFDAVATVALAMDVSPRLHHDKAHTKHGFCWIVACGDFVGGDLCIPQLGKRVVMRPGTVVAIRSTVVAYYLERYAKNTSMYVMYAYTSDNNWPPAA